MLDNTRLLNNNFMVKVSTLKLMLKGSTLITYLIPFKNLYCTTRTFTEPYSYK